MAFSLLFQKDGISPFLASDRHRRQPLSKKDVAARRDSSDSEAELPSSFAPGVKGFGS
jgi:hypothetical protein